jgi:3-oxoacyl-(acyl-carrier-protein) synthase
MADQNIVVTGLGVVSPVGCGVVEFWSAVLAGTPGISEITLFDTSPYLTHRGAQIKDQPGGDTAVPSESGALSRCERFALAAARMAIADAQLLGSNGRLAAHYPPDRIAVCFGTVMGVRPALEPIVRAWQRRRPPPPGTGITAHNPSRLGTVVAAELGLRGRNVVLATACAAGNSAIACGHDLITHGLADAVLAGGADEISEAMFMMFDSFRALAPERVQPFDLNRRGLILGEGAAVLVLETMAAARARDARIYGRVAGYASWSDAFHMTAPHPRGVGQVRSMRGALEMAGIFPGAVDYICAHGTGTPANDEVEARAIREAFGATADDVPVSSLKSVTGHPQGAASAIEAIACLLSIRDGVVPATAALEVPDPRCDLDLVMGGPRFTRVAAVLNNAFGFGGSNCCVLFTAPDP